MSRRAPEALRRNDDPPNSHVAVENWWPTGQTCLDRCLDLLMFRGGEWVDASEFVSPEIGGLNATRRLRELREQDDRIETRLRPDSSTVWQWRINSGRYAPPRPSVVVRQSTSGRVITRTPRPTPTAKPSTIPSRQDERKYGAKPKRGAQSKSPALMRLEQERAERAAKRAARRAKQ